MIIMTLVLSACSAKSGNQTENGDQNGTVQENTDQTGTVQSDDVRNNPDGTDSQNADSTSEIPDMTQFEKKPELGDYIELALNV